MAEYIPLKILSSIKPVDTLVKMVRMTIFGGLKFDQRLVVMQEAFFFQEK